MLRVGRRVWLSSLIACQYGIIKRKTKNCIYLLLTIGIESINTNKSEYRRLLLPHTDCVGVVLAARNLSHHVDALRMQHQIALLLRAKTAQWTLEWFCRNVR